jgi:hypothetical protein
MSRDFKDYFIGKPSIPTGQRIETDELLVLRGGIVHRSNALKIQGAAGMTDNAVDTVINLLDDWELVGGTMLEVFSTPELSFAANAFTFNGSNQLAYSIIAASATINKPANGLVEAQIGIFINGVMSGIGFSGTVNDGEPAYMEAKTGYQLQAGDIIDLRVRNRTSDQDLTIVHAGLDIQ